jgi:membrane associated rhomboid family serine protease
VTVITPVMIGGRRARARSGLRARGRAADDVIPLKDDVASSRVPVVTIGLIILNVVAFLYQMSLQVAEYPQMTRAAQEFVFEFGVIPCRLTGICASPADFPSPVLTIFTSMFLHGGLFHLLGNMLYLWIFGDSVEDTLGHGRFLLFYFISGAAAAVGQTATSPASQTPMIGASGAVSGVLGAYLILFPHAGILTLITFGFFFRLIKIPALLVLGFWIVIQFVNGAITFTGALDRRAEGGVAWFAHIGGFVAGIVLLFLVRPRRSVRL